MKFCHKLVRPALFACVFALSPALLLTARAQTPLATKNAEPQTVVSNEAEATRARQKRARAYAKLLAGQRLLMSARQASDDALVPSLVRQAQQAFQEAAQLDPGLAEAYTALAEIAFIYQRNPDEAVRQASIAVKINPNNFGAHQTLARIYARKSGLSEQKLDKQNAELAITELREVTRLSSNDAEAWGLLGELYLALGRMDEAIDALTHTAAAPSAVNPGFFRYITGRRELSPDSAAARLGEVLISVGRIREAVAAIRRALSLNPDSGAYEELLNRAIEASGADDAAVLTELRNMAAAEPQSTTAQTLLARVLTRAGRVDEALQLLRSAISRRAPTDKEGLFVLRLALAQTHADATRYAEAVTIYEEILREQGITGIAPLTDEGSKRMAGELLRRIISLHKSAGKQNEAMAAIERMRRLLGSDDPTIELEQINLLREQGKRREALQATREAARRFPQQDEFSNLEAGILTDMGQVDEGVAILRSRLSPASKTNTAASSSLADFELYLRISSLYSQAARGTEAVEAARQAVASAPADRQDMISAALVTLSSAQERAGDTKGSEESLRRVLAKEPDNATALNNLGYFLLERNERLPEALELIQRAVKVEPTNSSFLDSLGWAYFKLGKLEEAEKHLTDAARRDSTSATIQEHLGDVYQRQGKNEQARNAWQKALKLSVESDETTRLKGKLGGNLK